MQANDLNILATGNWDMDDFKTPESLINKIRISPIQTIGKVVTKEDILKLKTRKIKPSEHLLNEVKITASRFENLGKSRRWIRRYIKRKFNITEY